MRQNDPAEAARQRALDLYRVVDTLPEAAYDDIVRLAAMVCGVPIALVSLIDRDRQWFKACVGLDVRETPRDEAVCDHVIRQPETLLEVADLSTDPRFAHFPAVIGDEGLRFYAGMPLVTPGGAAIGTVCVVDRAPRRLSDEQRGALEALARLTINLLEARQRERVLERAALLRNQAAGGRRLYRRGVRAAALRRPRGRARRTPYRTVAAAPGPGVGGDAAGRTRR